MKDIVQWREDAECVEAFTTSLVIAEKFGKRHKNVLQAIESMPKDDFNRLNFQPVDYVDQKGERRLMYRITRDGFTLLAMGFTGKDAYQWKVKFIDAFNKMERQLRSMMRKGWLEHRAEAALEYRVMSRSLQETRSLEGKETKTHHYINEAKLVNWALTGSHSKLNRNELSTHDLKILCELQLHNAALLCAKVDRDQRKIILQERCRAYALKLTQGEAA